MKIKQEQGISETTASVAGASALGKIA